MVVKPQVNVPVEPELKQRLKRYSFEKDIHQKKVVEMAIDEFLTKQGYAKEEK